METELCQSPKGAPARARVNGEGGAVRQGGMRERVRVRLGVFASRAHGRAHLLGSGRALSPSSFEACNNGYNAGFPLFAVRMPRVATLSVRHDPDGLVRSEGRGTH